MFFHNIYCVYNARSIRFCYYSQLNKLDKNEDARRKYDQKVLLKNFLLLVRDKSHIRIYTILDQFGLVKECFNDLFPQFKVNYYLERDFLLNDSQLDNFTTYFYKYYFIYNVRLTQLCHFSKLNRLHNYLDETSEYANKVSLMIFLLMVLDKDHMRN